MSHVSKRCRTRCQQVLEELAAQSSVQVYPMAAITSAAASASATTSSQQLGARESRPASLLPPAPFIAGVQQAQSQAHVGFPGASSSPNTSFVAPTVAPANAAIALSTTTSAASLSANGSASGSAASRVASVLSKLIPDGAIDNSFLSYRM